MYRYIKGVVVEKGLDFVVLECNSIGYMLSASLNTINNIRLNEETKLFTILIVRDDEMSLCGFHEDEEREFFEYLVSVSGVGQKVAMGMLSSSSYYDIAKMIINAEEKNLTKLKGIGKKTAQRLIVELKDKLEKRFNVEGNEINFIDKKPEVPIAQNEIYEALNSLGFKNNEIAKMLVGIDIENISVESAISLALKSER